MHDFRNLHYLLEGSAVQREGYRVIEESCVMQTLASYNPVLAGTLPLDLYTEGSDLDILCEVHDESAFEKTLMTFASHDHFVCSRKNINSIPSVVCTWQQSGFLFEVFGQPVSVEQQYGYRHMIVESDILQRMGPLFREKIFALKQTGIKTEPAFAKLLGLSGNPYEALLTLDIHSLPCAE